MPAPKFLADYDQLAQIAQRFGREAEATQRMLGALRSAMSTLEGGDWVGQGARAFYAEMNGAVLPSLMRLTRALAEAQRVTLQISREIKAAEDAAAAVLHDDGATHSGSSKLARLEQGNPFNLSSMSNTVTADIESAARQAGFDPGQWVNDFINWLFGWGPSNNTPTPKPKIGVTIFPTPTQTPSPTPLPATPTATSTSTPTQSPTSAPAPTKEATLQPTTNGSNLKLPLDDPEYNNGFYYDLSHDGFDIRSKSGDTTVTAMTGGTVFATDLNDANPQFYYVWIMSPDGYVVQYTHLDPSTVKLQVNDTITEGQVLGNYGKFGNSTYSHLHVSFVEYDATTKKWNKYVHPGKYWPVKPDSFSGGSIGGGDDYDPTR